MPFIKNQILTHIKPNGNSAKVGALAIYQGEDRDYIRVKWIRNELSAGQMDGLYREDSFRVAHPDEIEIALCAIQNSLAILTEAAASNPPNIKVGDYVYRREPSGHVLNPYKVLEIYNGILFCYRITTRGDEHTTQSVNRVTHNPEALAKYPPEY